MHTSHHCLHDTCREPTSVSPYRQSAEDRTNGRGRRHLLCPLSRFSIRSRAERPEGSGPAFAGDDVAPQGSTPIRPITGRPSLAPSSFTRTAIGSPCGSLSLTGTVRAYRVPRVYPSGVGPPYPPAAICPRQGMREPLCRPRTFWSKPVSTFGFMHVTTVHSGVHIRWPIPLDSSPGPHWCSQARPCVTARAPIVPDDGCIVPRASNGSVTTTARLGRVLLVEQQVSSPPSHEG
jgi:hypothetical protein